MKNDTRHPRAFMTADVILALGIVLSLTMVMSVAVSKQARASQRLAETRAAIRLAEATLTALQSSQPAPAAPDGATVRVERINAPGELPAGCAWANVIVVLDGRRYELAGVIRADAVAFHSLSPVRQEEGWGEGFAANERCTRSITPSPSPLPSPRSTGQKEMAKSNLAGAAP